MSNTINLNGKWFGAFVLGEQYGNNKGATYYFEVDVKEEDGCFSGLSIESGIFEQMDKSITLSGFIENDLISYIKQYPYLVILNEQGDIQLDYRKSNPEMIFTGTYNKESNIFEGNVELIGGDYLENGLIYEELYTGTWVMGREQIKIT